MNPYKTSAKTAKGRAAMKSVGKRIGSPDKLQEPKSDKTDSIEINEADDVRPLEKSKEDEDD